VVICVMRIRDGGFAPISVQGCHSSVMYVLSFPDTVAQLVKAMDS